VLSHYDRWLLGEGVKDISRRDATAQSRGEEEKKRRREANNIEKAEAWGRALRCWDRPLLFLPPPRLCASLVPTLQRL
jgi:hypothetical protein